MQLRRTVVAALAAVAVAAPLVPARAGDGWQPPVCASQRVEARELTIEVEGQPASGLYALPEAEPHALVVFAHGYGHTSESWRHHLVRIAQRHRAITVAMDYRGTETKQGVVRGWRVAEGAADSIAAARLFEQRCGSVQTVVMYGVSMGGNTSGLALAAQAKRDDGRPLFDHWFAIEGAANVVETYLGARALAATGNVYASNAKADIEDEMGGPFEARREVYLERTVVNRAGDIAASGVQGVVLVHGLADGLVPYNQSRELAAALRARGVPVAMYTVATKRPGSEPGTTIDGYAPVPGYESPFAGHASERSTTHTVGTTGFDLLGQLLSGVGRVSPCDAEVLVDGMLRASAGRSC